MYFSRNVGPYFWIHISEVHSAYSSTVFVTVWMDMHGRHRSITTRTCLLYPTQTLPRGPQVFYPDTLGLGNKEVSVWIFLGLGLCSQRDSAALPLEVWTLGWERGRPWRRFDSSAAVYRI